MHLYIGEEAVAVGVMDALADEDSVVSTYREHGHALARGIPMDAVMAEMFGKVTGTSRGRGGSMHLFDVSRGFYGGNAIVAGGLPLAVGLALGHQLQRRPGVTVCFFGDGAVAEGEFHESLNLAALWNLPVLFVCENNLYAMGTALERELAMTDLALYASAYGIPAWPVDGMDVEAVDLAARRALDAVRGGEGPAFLEMRTYRFRAHSMYDPELYRDRAEVERWRQRDPIDLLVNRMREAAQAGPSSGPIRMVPPAGGAGPGRTRAGPEVVDAELARLEALVAKEIAAAIDTAEGAAQEPVEDLTRFVQSEAAP
jgi:pyruvate dehydrogenase E1 component alpha subunit